MKEIITGAIILERVTELIKSKLPKKYERFFDGLTISLILGIGFALSFELQFMSLVGLNSIVPFADEILTGILLTGGASGINAIIEAMQSITGSIQDLKGDE